MKKILILIGLILLVIFYAVDIGYNNDVMVNVYSDKSIRDTVNNKPQTRIVELEDLAVRNKTAFDEEGDETGFEIEVPLNSKETKIAEGTTRGNYNGFFDIIIKPVKTKKSELYSQDYVQFWDVGGEYGLPCNPADVVRLSSGYGMRKGVFVAGQEHHEAYDFGGDVGTPIYSIHDGTISKCYKSATFGNTIQVKHTIQSGTIVEIVYAHLKELPPYIVGDVVKRGQQIGKMGNTGWSDGSHLHMQLQALGDYDTKGNPFDALMGLPVSPVSVLGQYTGYTVTAGGEN